MSREQAIITAREVMKNNLTSFREALENVRGSVPSTKEEMKSTGITIGVYMGVIIGAYLNFKYNVANKMIDFLMLDRDYVLTQFMLFIIVMSWSVPRAFSYKKLLQQLGIKNEELNEMEQQLLDMEYELRELKLELQDEKDNGNPAGIHDSAPSDRRQVKSFFDNYEV